MTDDFVLCVIVISVAPVVYGFFTACVFCLQQHYRRSTIYELNSKKTKQVLIPKSQVVEKTVQMLNDLKDIQLDYYGNIFQVQETKNQNLLF